MSIGIFDQKEHPPKEAEMLAAVGLALDSWKALCQWIEETFPVQRELKYMYGKKYGWALRFQARGSLLTALYPTHNGFTAQVILNRAALEKAALLNLGESAKQAMKRANLYAEGKWLFIPVTSERDIADVKRLLCLKVEGTQKQIGRRPHASVSSA